MKVAILGAGSWGIALAKLAAENNCDVCLWEFDAQTAENLNKYREERKKLPGVKIPNSVKITHKIEEAITETELMVLVLPSQVFSSVAKKLSKYVFNKEIKFLIATKGLEAGSLCRMSEVLKQEVEAADDNNVAVLSGPSHAEEVGKNMPTSVVVASRNINLARNVQETLSNLYFRIYTNTDVTGVELAGALKNVIAIAAGISDGLGFGDNAKAALMTRGIVEISRLGRAMGADDATFLGLAGIGDLIVTCASKHSRNRYVGEQVGKGKTLSDVLENMVMVAEGVNTAGSALELSNKYNIEMPIIQQVCFVLFENKNPGEAVKELMTRDYKNEGE